ncbi:MAG TPA: class I SAM-dependent methyltransferase [Candidatus Limnocylindrales bacterium]
MDERAFYGPEQSGIHHEAFGRLAGRAADLLTAELAAAGLAAGTIVDLGCGSGILARRMTDAGFDVIGVDLSAAMLEIARREAPGARFVQGSLLDAELAPGSVAVTATGEALNYAVDARAGDDAFAALAARVAAALVPGGVLLFDVSVHGRSGPDRLRVQFHDRPGWSVGVRETEDDVSVTRAIATFRQLDDGRYERTDERHVLHLYDPDSLRSALEGVGFDVDLRAGYEPGESMMGWVVVLARRR